MSRALVIIGLLLVAAGLLWPLLSRLGLGKLPGDILIQRDDFTFYAPIASGVVVGIMLSLVLWLVNR
ncbi:DUF2905 domain-containing protein [Pseudaminobacter sp. 19-2017]|uniref:DUF2905 domain-containing protein n=1 Tax=Pseudaminobacter soli (ex Zhang et al. 2022) TaxID=2831468 RepID=A0A942E0R4_9HYPH|nr:DUF2905 domain-containing protein [Pseudaminobacter soli]MBS3650983.1 DUF2905 domain-containing protein [Pseudaminobacter soli]